MQLTSSVRPRPATPAVLLLVAAGAASAREAPAATRPVRQGSRNPFIDHPEWVASIWP